MSTIFLCKAWCKDVGDFGGNTWTRANEGSRKKKNIVSMEGIKTPPTISCLLQPFPTATASSSSSLLLLLLLLSFVVVRTRTQIV